jgi:hypothetical protein
VLNFFEPSTGKSEIGLLNKKVTKRFISSQTPVFHESEKYFSIFYKISLNSVYLSSSLNLSSKKIQKNFNIINK